MKITIFGSTGKTGQILVNKALKAGHNVIAFARNPEKMSISHENLSVFKGDALIKQDVIKALDGSDAVISLLGVNPKAEPLTFFNSIKNVLEAMEERGISRLVMSAGAGVGGKDDRVTILGSLMKGIIKFIARKAFEDGIKTATLVRSRNNLDWTLVRLPMLTDKEEKRTVKAGALGRGTGSGITRADAAEFMLTTLEEGSYIRKDPVISN